MSQVFTGTRKTGDAGYFRIGTEILRIPPESISTNRIAAIEEIPTLRTEHPTAKRSGHARIDIYHSVAGGGRHLQRDPGLQRLEAGAEHPGDGQVRALCRDLQPSRGPGSA